VRDGAAVAVLDGHYTVPAKATRIRRRRSASKAEAIVIMCSRSGSALHFGVTHGGEDVVEGGKALQVDRVGAVVCEEDAGSRLAESAAIALKRDGNISLNADHSRKMMAAAQRVAI
jgi:hypothetical protein